MVTGVSNTAKYVLCIGASIFEVENLWRPRRAHVFCSFVAEKPIQAKLLLSMNPILSYSFPSGSNHVLLLRLVALGACPLR
jgi:hypothetical protein